ncbi:MAG TPA: ABC transporter substrate-binding protein, partial [Thermodesulfobacteriota bacterium]|nr:ABC transporter substrate-binding protein [Thermodesulfobacteriota bacterium]
MTEFRKNVWNRMAVLGIAFSLGIPSFPLYAAQKELKIGAIFPLSGRGATWGLAAQKAITLKQKEVNGRGGLKVGTDTYKLEIMWEDDKYNAASGRMAAEKLVNRDKVKFILGSQSSAVILAVQPITESNKILFLVDSYAKEVLAPDKPYTFRMVLTSNEVLQGMYPWMTKTYPNMKNVAFVEPNDASGWSIEKDCKRLAEQNSVRVIFSQFYERGTSDF